MPYTSRPVPPALRPMDQMNITPLIDVMLVLLIVFIMAIPVATHALLVPLPTGPGKLATQAVNTVAIDGQDRLYWNGQRLDRQELLNQLATAAALPRQPQVRFAPGATASYDVSAKTIALIKDSGIETFAFVGNEAFRTFDAR